MVLSLLIMILYAETKEKIILDRISNKYLSKLPLQVEFDIIQKFSGQDQPQEISGVFYLNSDSSFRVKFPGHEILYDGKWLWSLDKSADQVVVEEFNTQSSLKFLYDIVNGNWGKFVADNISIFDSTANIAEINLRTKDENNFFRYIVLKVDTLLNVIKEANCVDFQQNNISIVFKNFIPIAYSDSLLFKDEDFNNKEL
ncbi:MAG: outer membrane lipoprotein carrier protein LolA, partial [Candidatus Marinimicrobia bacterium]|nr:outer membrane lipoprotein carrier protein LolA [Candidatus Neomarinimicrobiota bacterium]